LASQALVPFKNRTILLINSGTGTSRAINGAFLIADSARSNAGLDLRRVLLTATTAAGLFFVPTKEPPKEF
jgi:hypothetical protein